MLSVEAATAPSNYIYENLAISPLSRGTRIAISNAIVFLLLVLALVVVILLKSYQNTMLVRTAIPRTPALGRHPELFHQYYYNLAPAITIVI